MRFHTLLYAMAMTVLATLTPACGPQIVTTEKVVERTIFVCSDKSRVDDPDACPPGPVTEKVVYECEGNKNTGPVRVDSPEECPIWTMTCPDGTTSYADHERNDMGCTYDATCHEGWAYEPSTKACKKFCQVGETLSMDGLTCVPIPSRAQTGIIVGFTPDFTDGNIWQVLAGTGLTVAWLQAWSNGYAELSDFDFTVELSGNEAGTWTSNLGDVTAALRACTIYQNHPFGVFGDGVLHAAADGKVHLTSHYSPGLPLVGGVETFGVLCDTNSVYVPPESGLKISLRLNLAGPHQGSAVDVYYGQQNDRRDTYGVIRRQAVLEPRTNETIHRIHVGGESAIPFDLQALGDAIRVTHITVEACLAETYPCPSDQRVSNMTGVRYDVDATVESTVPIVVGTVDMGRGDLGFGRELVVPNGRFRNTYLYVTLDRALTVGTMFYLHVVYDQSIDAVTGVQLPEVRKTLSYEAIAQY